MDRVRDPRVLEALGHARLGQAYFARRLNELSSADLAERSRIPGWTRAHVVAHVGYHARAIARLVEWAETGVETPMHESEAARIREIELGATLSERALRHLTDHAAVQLDVAWRDLPDERWSFPVRTLDGRSVPVSETVWMRSSELWRCALDLGNGGRLADAPEPVARLIAPNAQLTPGAPGAPGAPNAQSDPRELIRHG